MKIESKKYLQRPRLIKSSSASHDKSKYYRFHRDHGHDIEEYIQLRNKIEDLIRHGYLGKCVHGEAWFNAQNLDQWQAQAEIDNQPRAGPISMIS